MKKFIPFVISISSVAHAQNYGHCKALPYSKKYLSSNFEQAYPRSVSFTCKYDCLGSSGTKQIQAKSEVLVNSVFEDATKVVCQGVKVRKSRWGFELDSVNPFYAPYSHLSEIRDWALKNVTRDPKMDRNKLLKLKSQLKEISASYEAASKAQSEYSKAFFEASQILSKIERELPQKKDLLNKTIKALQTIPLQPAPSKDSLVKGALHSYIDWLTASNQIN